MCSVCLILTLPTKTACNLKEWLTNHLGVVSIDIGTATLWDLASLCCRVGVMFCAVANSFCISAWAERRPLGERNAVQDTLSCTTSVCSSQLAYHLKKSARLYGMITIGLSTYTVQKWQHWCVLGIISKCGVELAKYVLCPWSQDGMVSNTSSRLYVRSRTVSGTMLNYVKLACSKAWLKKASPGIQFRPEQHTIACCYWLASLKKSQSQTLMHLV